jgi:hypothetical protein
MDELNTQIDQRIRTFMKGPLFSARKLGDTPTDSFALVPRGYVTANGLLASRPNSSVATVGQPFFATDTNIPMTYSTTGWRNGVGSVVAQT